MLKPHVTLSEQTAMTKPLSPAAQSVMDAFWNGLDCGDDWGNANLAAALRAAADQVVPLPRLPYDSCCDVSASAIRAELMAIAAELEGQS